MKVFFITTILALIGIFILLFIIGVLIDYYYYHKDKVNKRNVKLSYKQFKEFFYLSPDSYGLNVDIESFPHIVKGTDLENPYMRAIDYSFSFTSYIDYCRAVNLVKNYKNNKLKIKENKLNTEITNAFIEEIKKEIARTDKEANEELLKGAEIVNKVLLDK